MKKLLFVLAVAGSLVACDNSGSGTGSTDSTATDSATTTTTTTGTDTTGSTSTGTDTTGGTTTGTDTLLPKRLLLQLLIQLRNKSISTDIKSPPFGGFFDLCC